MIDCTSSINFTSKIKIVSSYDFENLLYKKIDEKLPCSTYPWEKKQIVSGNQAYTTGARTCSAGGITSNGRVTLFHLHPGEPNSRYFDEIEDVFVKKSKLKKSSDDKRGFISGGIKDDRYSEDIFGKVKGFFERNNINHSIIWGQESHRLESDTLYDGAKDTWYLASNRAVNSFEDLKKTFKIVDIADGDKLFIDGKKVKIKH